MKNIDGRTHRRLANGSKSHLLSGKLFCADCGHRLTYCSPDSYHRKNGKAYPSDSCFRCGGYKSITRNCTSHYIRTDILENYIKNHLEKIRLLITDNRIDLKEMLLSHTITNDNITTAELEKSLHIEKLRLSEITHIITKIYEDNVSGKLNDQQFQCLMYEYENEQTAIKERIKEFDNSLIGERNIRKNITAFMDSIKRYDNFSKPSPEIVNTLIEKIVIHEAVGRGSSRQQDIEIYYNYVGKIDFVNVYY